MFVYLNVTRNRMTLKNINRIVGVIDKIVNVLVSSAVDHYRGFETRLVKSKTIKLVYAAS